MSAGDALRPVMKAAARTFDVLRAPARGISILIYHRVGADTRGQMNLSPGAFRRQVEWLAGECRVLTLDEAVAEIGGPGPVAPGVVLTFDDGTTDWVDVVAPILEEFAVPATFYLTTGYPEGDHPLPDGAPALSWAGVEELGASDLATIGSHTHSHVLLDRLDPTQIAAELDRSVELIADRLGAAPRHFAYPKAVPPSAPARAAVRERFGSATLAGTRSNVAGDDLFALSRSPIQLADSFDDFRRKVAGGMGMEDRVRQRLNAVRYRGVSR